MSEQDCDRCGRPALGILGDEALCEDCVHEVSACCGSFGGEQPQKNDLFSKNYVIA